MKTFALLLVLSTAAFAQSADSPKVVTFSRADTEHCKVVVANGKPLLSTTFNGTTVAVTMPQNWGNGEFSLFVSVEQDGANDVQINPKEVSAVYSDPEHTRFRWFDKGHDLDTQISMRAAGLGQPGAAAGSPGGGSLGDSASAMPPPTHPEVMRESDPHTGTRSEEEARQLGLRNAGSNVSNLPQIDPAHPPVFLKRATLKQGAKAAGYVFMRRPKGSKVEVAANGMLDEVDIPVNGVTFRF